LTAVEVLPEDSTTFVFSHPLSLNSILDLSAEYFWSKDLVTFYADGETDSEGTTVYFSGGGFPINGMVYADATIEGTSADKLFVKLQVTVEETP